MEASSEKEWRAFLQWVRELPLQKQMEQIHEVLPEVSEHVREELLKILFEVEEEILIQRKIEPTHTEISRSLPSRSPENLEQKVKTAPEEQQSDESLRGIYRTAETDQEARESTLTGTAPIRIYEISGSDEKLRQGKTVEYELAE